MEAEVQGEGSGDCALRGLINGIKMDFGQVKPITVTSLAPTLVPLVEIPLFQALVDTSSSPLIVLGIIFPSPPT